MLSKENDAQIKVFKFKINTWKFIHMNSQGNFKLKPKVTQLNVLMYYEEAVSH